MSSGQCIHELVNERARTTPGAIAVVSGNRKITFQELDARSNRVAQMLCSSGIGPDVPVALIMQRSIEFVIGALGVLKAGGTYVPLDPSYPANRVSWILEDSGVSIILTEPCLSSQVPVGAWKVLLLEPGSLNSVQYPSDSPGKRTSPDNLAYIIFTSGSTGRPKGVRVTHASLMNLVSWHRKAFGVMPADKATLHASPGFDASVWELWPHLAAGASVYVVEEEIRSAPEALCVWIVANGITISFLPTALAERMIGLSWPRATSLRFLLTGADTLRRRPPKGLPFKLINNYGPTECTVVATSGIVQPDDENDQQPSIGRPIDNAEIYIVDQQMKPVAAGETGELLIGGAGVARGYVSDPDLTEKKFVPDVFSTRPGSRLYRTGDLGRYLPNGEIAFLGRMDEQIKIMGYRVEPREVRSALDRYPGIRQSVLKTHRDETGSLRLVAYLVPDTSARLKPSEIRAFLASYLPDYMVPQAFVSLPELPFSEHGKLNHAALPEPGPDNILKEDSYEPPESTIEQHLASFLSELVNVDRVGRNDNFFTLGGHSLMGAQLIAKIRETFGVDLSLRALFEAPTVREMSAVIEKLICEKVSSMSEEEAQRLLAS